MPVGSESGEAKTHVAVAALVEGGRLLLVHRHPARENYPDCWDLPGGHVEPGERPDAAVRRECFEELGIQIHNPLPFTLTCSNSRIHKHAFLVTSWDGIPTNVAHLEHDDLDWFTVDQLASLTMADPTSLDDLASLMPRPA